MTLAIRAAASVFNDSITNTVTVAKPSGVASGDLMVAFVEANGAGASILTPPSGWTQKGAETGNSNILSECWYKVAGGSEPSTYSWGLSASLRCRGTIVAYSGQDTTSPFDAYAHGLGTTSAAPTVTAVGTGCALLVSAFARHPAAAHTLTDTTGTDSTRAAHGAAGGGSFDFSCLTIDAFGVPSGSNSRSITSSGTENAIAWHAMTIKPLASTLLLRVYESYVETPAGAPPLRLRVYGANLTSDSAAGGKSLRVYEARVEAPQPAGGIGESGIRTLIGGAWQQVTPRTLIGGEW